MITILVINPLTYAVSDNLVQADTLNPLGGICDGIVWIEIVDNDAVTGHGYKLTFDEHVILSVINEDTTWGLGYTLIDTTEMDTLFYHQALPDTDDVFPVVDGFKLGIRQASYDVKWLGWTPVAGDTCTFDWRIQSKYPELVPSGMVYGKIVESRDDWRLVVDYNDSTEVQWLDLFIEQFAEEPQYLPLRVEIINDTLNPIDISRQTILGEFALSAPEEYRQNYYSPLGWDLIPGGAGFNPASPGWYEKHVDALILEKIDTTADGDTIPNYLYLYTNNKPDSSYNRYGELEIIDARAPSDGDEFTIITNKPLRNGIWYEFHTEPGNVGIISSNADGIPNKLNVHKNYPNPFNPVTTIHYSLPVQTHVKLRVLDITGREVSVLLDEVQSAGEKKIQFRAKDLPSGIYFYQISAEKQIETKKMILIK